MAGMVISTKTARVLCSLALPALLAACGTATSPAIQPANRALTDSEAVAHMLAAKKAERDRDYPRALTEWRLATEAAPASPALRVGYAGALMEVGDEISGLQQARLAAELDTALTSAYRLMAEHYHRNGNAVSEIDCLERVVRLEGDGEAAWRLVTLYHTVDRTAQIDQVLRILAEHPSSRPFQLLRWARKADGLRLNESCEVFYRTLVARWPHCEDGLLEYGDYLDKRGRGAEAEALFRSALRATPTARRTARHLAWMLLGQERWQEADSVMMGISAVTGEDLKERKAWVALLLRNQQNTLAERELEALLPSFPDEVDLYVFLGQAHMGQREFSQSALAFEQAARRDSTLPVLTGLVLAQAEAGRLVEAERTARKAVAKHPGNDRLLQVYGIVLRARGKWGEASAVFESLVRRDSTNTEHLYNWATSLERSGDYLGATAALTRLLALKPHDPHVLNFLGYLYADNSIHLQEALHLVTQALAQDPQSGAYLDSMGWVLYRLGRPREAVKYLVQALKYEQSDPVILDHLGDVYEALGQRREALESWRKALSADPHLEGVRRKLERRSPQ